VRILPHRSVQPAAPAGELVSEFRRRVIEEAAEADLRGLVFTFVWGLDLPDDTDIVASYIDIVESRGGRVRLVELYADHAERVARNGTPFRLARKPSKRDLNRSNQDLAKLDAEYVLNTGGGTGQTSADNLINKHDYLRIDNTHLTAPDAAQTIVDAFGMSG
jgi:hypothetical protein